MLSPSLVALPGRILDRMGPVKWVELHQPAGDGFEWLCLRALVVGIIAKMDEV